MIDDDTEGMVVTSYGDANEQRRVLDALERLREGTPDARLLLRRLQPYIVAVYRRELPGYERAGLIKAIMPGLWEWHGKYHTVQGLIAEGPDPDKLVV
jgi:hypothetical protein